MASRSPPVYRGAIPAIEQAYRNDPRTLLAASALASGTKGDALPAGKWAIPAGLSKAGEAILGAYMTKKLRKEYGPLEEQYMADLESSSDRAHARNLEIAAALAGSQSMGQAPGLGVAAMQSALPQPSPQPSAPMPAAMVNSRPTPLGTSPGVQPTAPTQQAVTPNALNPATLNPSQPNPARAAAARLVGPPSANFINAFGPANMPAVDPGKSTAAMAGQGMYLPPPIGTPATGGAGAYVPGQGPMRQPLNYPPPRPTAASAAAARTSQPAAANDRLAAERRRVGDAEGSVGVGGYNAQAYNTSSTRNAAGLEQQPLTSMTIGQVLAYQRGPMRAKTRGFRSANDPGSTGVGRYQFESSTLEDRARKVFGEGYKDVPFNRANQDKLFDSHYAEHSRAGTLGSQWNTYRSGSAPRGDGLPNVRVTRGGSSTRRGDVVAPGRVEVAAPEYEDVPASLPLTPSQAPTAPRVPDAVISERLLLAKELLKSRNPFLASMAENYLNQGLAEDFQSRSERNKQQFETGIKGYDIAGQEWAQGRNVDRQARYTAQQNALQRNTDIYRDVRSQEWQSGEKAADRQLEASIKSADLDQQYWKTEYDNYAQTWRDAYGENMRQTNARDPFWETGKGLDLRVKMQDESNKVSSFVDKLDRYIYLNEKQETGGAYGLPVVGQGIAQIAGAYDDELDEMGKLSNEMVLEMTGGSLGAQISNSDRDFIMRAMPSLGSRKKANTNVAKVMKAAKRREQEYIQEKYEAFGRGDDMNFIREWRQYKDEVDFVYYDKKGNAQVEENPPSFDEWRATRGG